MKTLRLELYAPDEYIFSTGTEIFSRVTCYLALKRMENFTVIVHGEESDDFSGTGLYGFASLAFYSTIYKAKGGQML